MAARRRGGDCVVRASGRRRAVAVHARTACKAGGAIIYLDKPNIEPEPAPVSLSDLNDRARWRSALDNLLTSQPIVRVMHLCDLHEPFSDPDVKEAAFALVQLVQPDIIVRGSDEDDNSTISVWAEEGAEEPEIEDFLDTMQMSRSYNTRRLKLVAPRALQVNIEGNHGYPRFIKWVNKKARQSKTTLLRHYIENIRCNGKVFFIGFKQSVRIHDNLLVMHGKKWGGKIFVYKVQSAPVAAAERQAAA
jgi:hypothetical protein